jgi:hypothetical protein
VCRWLPDCCDCNLESPRLQTHNAAVLILGSSSDRIGQNFGTSNFERSRGRAMDAHDKQLGNWRKTRPGRRPSPSSPS